jgi:hypothetical protein
MEKNKQEATSIYPFEGMATTQGFAAGFFSERRLEEIKRLCIEKSEKTGFSFEARQVGEFIHVYRTE